MRCFAIYSVFLAAFSVTNAAPVQRRASEDISVDAPKAPHTNSDPAILDKIFGGVIGGLSAAAAIAIVANEVVILLDKKKMQKLDLTLVDPKEIHREMSPQIRLTEEVSDETEHLSDEELYQQTMQLLEQTQTSSRADAMFGQSTQRVPETAEEVATFVQEQTKLARQWIEAPAAVAELAQKILLNEPGLQIGSMGTKVFTSQLHDASFSDGVDPLEDEPLYFNDPTKQPTSTPPGAAEEAVSVEDIVREVDSKVPKVVLSDPAAVQQLLSEEEEGSAGLGKLFEGIRFKNIP